MLCWTHDDRTEWVYWKNSIAEDFQIDKFICPQSIEKVYYIKLLTNKQIGKKKY